MMMRYKSESFGEVSVVVKENSLENLGNIMQAKV